MINPQFIVLAAEKATDHKARERLKHIEAIASELATLEKNLPGQIEENKRKRNQKPERLSKSQKEFLAHVDDDMADIDREQIELFKQAQNANEILEALIYVTPGLPQDYGYMLPHAHPADRPAIERVVDLQRTLNAEIRKFLELYPTA